jgi:MoaE-MoaD fusion protein
MNLHIRLFAGLADVLGTSVLDLQIDQESITIEQLKARILAQFPDAANKLQSCFFAKNQAYAAPDDIVTEGDEIAIIPPVSGGQGTPPSELDASSAYTLTYEKISVEEVTAKVLHPSHGATLAFVGTTREYTLGQRTVLLEYDAYAPMALKTMEQIGSEIADKWPGTLCAITHRLGPVGIGETSVVISISSPHRAACYEASRYSIERLKQIVPIWKKEIWEDGSEWKGHQLGPWNPTLPLEEK